MLPISSIVCVFLFFLRESRASNFSDDGLDMHVGRPRNVPKAGQCKMHIVHSTVPTGNPFLSRQPPSSKSKKRNKPREVAIPDHNYRWIKTAQKALLPLSHLASADDNLSVNEAIQRLEQAGIPGSSNSYPLLFDGKQYTQSTATVDSPGTSFFAGKSIKVQIQDGALSDASFERTIEADADGVIIGISGTLLHTFERPRSSPIDIVSPSRSNKPMREVHSGSSFEPSRLTKKHAGPQKINSNASFAYLTSRIPTEPSLSFSLSRVPTDLPQSDSIPSVPTHRNSARSDSSPSKLLPKKFPYNAACVHAMITSPMTSPVSHIPLDVLNSNQCIIL